MSKKGGIYLSANVYGSSIVHSQIKQLCSGSTREFLNQKILNKLVFDIPPIQEQHEIVRQVEKLFVFADKLEAHYKIAKERIEKLPQSVLAKAFRGELVPQDPTGESAEKLLELIKEEKIRLETELKKNKSKNTTRTK